MKRYKKVIVSGCSFTQRPDSWAYCMSEDHPEVEVVNTGIGGVGNYIISRSCISATQDALDSGTKPEDIFVVVQWSSIYRKSMIANSSVSSGDKFMWEQCASNFSFKNAITSNKNYKMTSCAGRRKNSDFWRKYFVSYWSDEKAFVSTLEDILFVQAFLESRKINYKMFTAWDIFTKQGTGTPGVGSDKVNNPNQFDSHTPYANINNHLLKDSFPTAQQYWQMINFDNFVFYKNEKVKLGGLAQWVQHNLENVHWHVHPTKDKHPTSHAQKMYYKDFLSNHIL